MAVAHHRAPPVFAMRTGRAAVLAIGIGLVIGFGVAVAIRPDLQGVATGLSYGIILGIPAAVAVVFVRRTVEYSARPCVIALAGVLGVVLAATLLFALTQFDARMAPMGAALGVVTGVASLVAGLARTHHRPEGEQVMTHRQA